MDAGDIINAALSAGGKMTGGDTLFIPEGNCERNELRVLRADECFKNNVAARCIPAASTLKDNLSAHPCN